MRGTVGGVEERYSFTTDGLHNLAVYGVSPAHAWSALTALRRVIRYLGDELDETDVKVVFAQTEGGYLVVFLAESDRDDNDWDIIAARHMWPDEVAMFEKVAAGG
ncbi:MAG TPA: hypothetical protein VGJ07_10740 [Rugosimonospora sp.]